MACNCLNNNRGTVEENTYWIEIKLGLKVGFLFCYFLKYNVMQYVNIHKKSMNT